VSAADLVNPALSGVAAPAIIPAGTIATSVGNGTAAYTGDHVGGRLRKSDRLWYARLLPIQLFLVMRLAPG
jgi:hypothetical protein